MIWTFIIERYMELITVFFIARANIKDMYVSPNATDLMKSRRLKYFFYHIEESFFNFLKPNLTLIRF